MMGRKRKAEHLSDLALKLDNGHGVGGVEMGADGAPLTKDDDRQGSGEDDSVQRSTANARERDRMRVLSKAFTKLKTTLPWVPPDTKLSKLDTLKLASCYIAHLRQILADDNSENSPVMAGIAARSNHHKTTPTAVTPASIHPLSLTWPFSFNGRYSGSSDTFYVDSKKSRTLGKPS